METITQTRLPLKLYSRGKVRDIYELGDGLLIISTDRLSVFDVVFNEGIPYKGAVLTQMSAFWFNITKNIINNHMVSTDISELSEEIGALSGELKYRSMLVKKTQPIKAECIVRGYLAGSGWKSYMKTGRICGVELPAGLKEGSKLPEPIFTPTTKEDVGVHDVEISAQKLAEKFGADVARELEEKSLRIYEFAAEYARKRGIIIADTKFEFGQLNGEIILIDELLTPDSSRFWPESEWEPGKPQKSFDKQFVRDYLESIGWNKCPPPPNLPIHVIEETSKKYIEAYERIAGKKFVFKG